MPTDEEIRKRAAEIEGKLAQGDKPVEDANPKSWKDGIVTAHELQTKQFKPVRIIVPQLIPEGVTILAGKPKVGKSWLAYDICIAAAGDRFVLGTTKPVQGDVLYLALEDNQRRLKKRLEKILQTQRGPARLELHTEWKRVDQGGLEDIEEWCKSKSEPRLIWIDTLAKIRPLLGRNEQAYVADYRAIEGLQRLAGRYGVGIVLNHHLRKMASEDDAFDEVSGTLGLTGAADTIIVMKRHSGMMKVHVRGRDIEEAEFAAEFNRETCRWRLVGTAEEIFRSKERQSVIEALKDTGPEQPMSVSEIMAAIERTDRNSIDQLLYKMKKAGEILQVGRGLYALRPKVPLDTGKIGQKALSERVPGDEAIDSASFSAPDKSYRESYRDLTGAETGKIAGKMPQSSNPLADKDNNVESYHLTDLTGPLRVSVTATPPDRRCAACGGSDGLLFPHGFNGELYHTPCWWGRPIPPDRSLALGPPGDSLDDLI